MMTWDKVRKNSVFSSSWKLRQAYGKQAWRDGSDGKSRRAWGPKCRLPASTGETGWAMCAWNPSSEWWRQVDVWACWPASLAEFASFRFSERPCLKKIRWRVTEEVSQHWPLSPTPLTSFLCVHPHTGARTQTYTHMKTQNTFKRQGPTNTMN